jgi:hypothetical protein
MFYSRRGSGGGSRLFGIFQSPRSPDLGRDRVAAAPSTLVNFVNFTGPGLDKGDAMALFRQDYCHFR